MVERGEHNTFFERPQGVCRKVVAMLWGNKHWLLVQKCHISPLGETPMTPLFASFACLQKQVNELP